MGNVKTGNCITHEALQQLITTRQQQVKIIKPICNKCNRPMIYIIRPLLIIYKPRQWKYSDTFHPSLLVYLLG